jgi:DNA-binding transcriptional MocR family regulator
MTSTTSAPARRPGNVGEWTRSLREKGNGVGGNTLLAALVLSTHMEWATGDRCRPTRELLSLESGVSKSSIDRGISRLEREGWLRRTAYRRTIQYWPMIPLGFRTAKQRREEEQAGIYSPPFPPAPVAAREPVAKPERPAADPVGDVARIVAWSRAPGRSDSPDGFLRELVAEWGEAAKAKAHRYEIEWAEAEQERRLARSA